MGHQLRGLTESERVRYKTVGPRVDAFCEQNHLSAPDFAALIGMGVPASRVGEWRRHGKAPASVDVYRRVEHVLEFYGTEQYTQPTHIPTTTELRHQDPNYTIEAISARLNAYRRKEGGMPYGDIATRLAQHGCTVTTVQLAHYARGASLPPPPTYLSLKAALDQLEGSVSGDAASAFANQPQTLSGGSLDQLLATFQQAEGSLQQIRTTLLDGVLAALAPHLPTTHGAAQALQEPLSPEQRAEYAVGLFYALYLTLDTAKMDPAFRTAVAAALDAKDVGYLQTLVEAMALPKRDFAVSIREALRPPQGPRRKP